MKKKTNAQLKKVLWKVFSDYVRKRDKNICYTCGRFATKSGYHCGHFIPKSVGGLALYFHEDNNHGQCYNCNINLGGNQYIYGQKLGDKKAKELYALKQTTTKWSQEDFEKKIEHYKKLI